MIGGVIRTIATFAPPLTLSANDAYASSNTPSFFSSASTATPSGGTAPFSYAWSSPQLNPTQPNNATTNFEGASFNSAVFTATVVCTDATGATASASINIYFTRGPGGGGGVEN